MLVFVNEHWLHLAWLPTLSEILQTSDYLRHPHVTVQQDEIAVHFVDVGQGDCSLIITPDKTALIDCGEDDDIGDLIRYIRSFGVGRLDYVIGTHPHSDHIGGMPQILSSFEVGEFIMSDIPDGKLPTTDYYIDLLDVIDERNIDAVYAEVGREIVLCEGTVLRLIGPLSDRYIALNDHSVVAKLESGNYSFLFTGDMEKEAELDLVASFTDLRADVLKVGHHGSVTSSCSEFLQRVRPDYAVISVGEDNHYGHPVKKVVDRIVDTGAEVLTTKDCGSIVFVTDGNELYHVTAENKEDAA